MKQFLFISLTAMTIQASQQYSNNASSIYIENHGQVDIGGYSHVYTEAGSVVREFFFKEIMASKPGYLPWASGYCDMFINVRGKWRAYCNVPNEICVSLSQVGRGGPSVPGTTIQYYNHFIKDRYDCKSVTTTLVPPQSTFAKTEKKISQPKPDAITDKTSRTQTIAVLDLVTNTITVSKEEARTLSEKVRALLLQTDHEIIERQSMNDILKEQGFQQTGCTSQECAVEIGKLIGVNTIIAGSIGKVGRTFYIYLRLIDVESGKIVRMASGESSNLDDVLRTELASTLNKLLNENGNVKDTTLEKTSAMSLFELIGLRHRRHHHD